MPIYVYRLARTSDEGRAVAVVMAGETVRGGGRDRKHTGGVAKVRDAFTKKNDGNNGVATQLQTQIEDLEFSRGEGAASGEVAPVGVGSTLLPERRRRRVHLLLRRRTKNGHETVHG